MWHTHTYYNACRGTPGRLPHSAPVARTSVHTVNRSHAPRTPLCCKPPHASTICRIRRISLACAELPRQCSGEVPSTLQRSHALDTHRNYSKRISDPTYMSQVVTEHSPFTVGGQNGPPQTAVQGSPSLISATKMSELFRYTQSTLHTPLWNRSHLRRLDLGRTRVWEVAISAPKGIFEV
jgi:hypothetical protein